MTTYESAGESDRGTPVDYAGVLHDTVRTLALTLLLVIGVTAFLITRRADLPAAWHAIEQAKPGMGTGGLRDEFRGCREPRGPPGPLSGAARCTPIVSRHP